VRPELLFADGVLRLEWLGDEVLSFRLDVGLGACKRQRERVEGSPNSLLARFHSPVDFPSNHDRENSYCY
jgi:hypothetical protein